MVNLTSRFQEIISAYNTVVGGIDREAAGNHDRAYGGIVRAGKGQLTESIAKELVYLAWATLDQDSREIDVKRYKYKIPIRMNYVETIRDERLRNHISAHIDDYVYESNIDWTVMIRGEPKMCIECKTYTENAMLKRVLVDASLLKQRFPDMDFVLLQLESQLGGDYCQIGDSVLGSCSTHTLLSHFDIDLDIITLLKGDRRVDKPIHKKEFFKPLTEESLRHATQRLAMKLSRYRRS
ncbi:restriction endonuclease DdeI [Methanoculleus sediminis]|uniref:Restriction endonuclease DdeI n=1 Tax=Methanoculleus sediminis TaxID=1550566 RepID=A0A0H1R0Q2_9EURY|nr:hypothetical protein [Methanoculleus sediminis]KLK88376.1 restriction endonuclease DdeI [Methanoculleus sediminis]